jgi:hypothetical protein
LLKENGHSKARDEIHKYYGVSKRKVAELTAEYKKTGIMPKPKAKEPWNKGMINGIRPNKSCNI